MFSSRLPPVLRENDLSLALARLRQSGADILDLTETNPTAAGLAYPADLLAALADPRGLSYRPHPLGLEAAREAVAATYSDRVPSVSAQHIALTASTSEAYAFLFKLLCDPGDAVLVPQPSYPLFDLLSRLEGVRAIPYRLDPHAAWALDRDGVEEGLAQGVRAILVVSPNNPTGSMIRTDDRDWLAERSAERGVAIISDEVFADYPLSPRAHASSFVGEARALTFSLGGLSKSVGLPQMKLAWIVVSGPHAEREAALARLELIADTYLSVSTPVQAAASQLLDLGRDVRRSVQARLQENLESLRSCVRLHPSLTLVEPEGGWSAVLRVPAIDSEERLVMRLLNEARVLVHPGYFFDFSEEAFLVLSLLTKPAVFEDGLARLAPVVLGAHG